jgi:hypothetical protein
MLLRSLSTAACTFLLASTTLVPANAQMCGMGSMAAPQGAKKLASPAAVANVTLAGANITINYNSPSMRGREIFGGLVPYNKVWRTGANPATTLVTPVDLHIGRLLVPAGTYTLYTLPSKDKWLLIINKHTKQWGTEYYPAEDLGRVELKHHTLDTPQEMMSISFDDIKHDSAELHIRWATEDESVKLTTP